MKLLIPRLLIFNLCGLAATFYAAKLGYVTQIFAGDISHISYAIVALFVFGLASTFSRAIQLTRRPENAKAELVRQAHLFDIAEWLVLLGLAGNVIGFLIAFHSIDAAQLSEAAGMQRIGLQVLAGLGVAFYSTLAGTICALWTSINFRLLSTTTELLASREASQTLSQQPIFY